MAKPYWVVTYRSIKNADAFAAYAKKAVPAVEAAGDALSFEACRPRYTRRD